MDINTTANNFEPTLLDQFMLAGWLHKLQTVVAAALVLFICAYVPTLRSKAQLAKLPIFQGATERKLYLTSARKLYRDGYEKFRDSVYRMRTSDGVDNIVIPQGLLPELRKLPDDVLSFPRAIEDLMEVKYTKLATEGKLIIHSIKSDLTPALSRLNPIVRNEIDSAMEKHLPPCKEWTEVNINQKLVDIVARVSGRIFVGPDLCQDPEYLECSTHYTVYLMQAVHAIKQLNPWFKSYLAPRIPEIKRLRDMEHRAAIYLEPLVRSRLDAEKNDPNWERPDDMLQWIINRYEGQGEVSVDELVKAQLGLIFAAIHTTTTTATCILYTLAVTPEYIGPLRDEIKEVMAQNEGEITSRSLQQMVKLDSYMKEVARMFPLGLTSFSRRVLKDFTLSNGQHVPKGVTIEVPSEAIANDPTIHPDSANFDGFRHYKLRSGGSATDHARNQFVTTNENNLFFGYGRHACPGRFFATNEIKMILAKLILDYDIKMPGEGIQVGLESRHPDIQIARGITPDPRKTLMFKRVEA